MDNDISGTYDYFKTLIKIKGMEAPCLLFECRHDKKLKQTCQQLGYTVYEIRHSENNWANPQMIERSVSVNFWGYVALNNAEGIGVLDKKLGKDGFFQVNSHSLNRFDDDVATYFSNSTLPVSR